MKNKQLSKETKNLCGMSMFVALSVAASFLTMGIRVDRLTFDAKDAVITIAAYIYGPVSSILMSFISASIESMITGFETGPIGWLMDILSSVTFAFSAALIYRYKRSFSGALISLGAASAIVVAAMVLFNMIFSPLFYRLKPFDPYIMALIPTLYLPFNIAKALMNSAIVMYLYKPATFALSKAKLLDTEEKTPFSFNKKSVVIIICGFVFIIAAIAVFLLTYFLNPKQ